MERKGICKNVGACKLANKVQTITDDDADFVCQNPDCGEPLQKYEEPEPERKKNKLPLIIGGGVVAAAIIGGGIFAFSGGSNEPSESVVIDSLETDTVQTQAMPVPADTVVVRDTLVERDTVVVRDTVVQKVAVSEKKSTKTTATPSSTSGTVRLGYGSYTGAMKSGKPHGQGRLTYSTSHQISRKDAKQRVAEAGDYIIGEFYDGELVQGIWYGADNQVKGSVMIGR